MVAETKLKVVFFCTFERKFISIFGFFFSLLIQKSQVLLGIKPPYDPVTPLLGIYPEETKIERDTCIPLFTAALFTVARTWKQPRCPSTDEWIKMLWYVYTMDYYSAIKKNAFESVLMRQMNLEPIIQSETSQKEKDNCLLRKLYAGQEATVRTGHGTTDWFQIGK